MGYWKTLWNRFWNGSTADFANMTDEKLTKFIEKNVDMSDARQFSYVDQQWGHAIQIINEVNQNPLIHKVTAFNSGGQIIGTRFIQVGDTMVLKTDTGPTPFLVVHLERVENPNDSFHAYIVGIDTKVET